MLARTINPYSPVPWWKGSSTRLISPSFFRVQIVPTGNSTAQKWCCTWHCLPRILSSVPHQRNPWHSLEFHLGDFFFFLFAPSRSSYEVNNLAKSVYDSTSLVLKPGLICPSGDTWQHMETFLVTTVEEEGLLAPSKSRLKMRNILQLTGQPPTKNYLAPNGNSAKAEKCLYTEKSIYTSVCPCDSYHLLGMKAMLICIFIPKFPLKWGGYRQTNTSTVKLRKLRPKEVKWVAQDHLIR